MLQESSQELTDSESNSNDTIDKFVPENICAVYTSETDSELIVTEDNDSCCNTWTSKTFKPTLYKFTSKEDSGITRDIGTSAKVIDYFQFFVSEEFVEFIANEINHCWSQEASDNVTNPEGTMSAELYCFIALSFLMTRNKKFALSEYWSKDKLLHTEIFGEIMTRDRYLKLLTMLHFSRNLGSVTDRLCKLQSLVHMLRKAFNELFKPDQKLSIKVSFKQLVCTKTSKFDVKSFILSDCQTGFVQDIFIYNESSTAVDSENGAIGKSEEIVESLMKPYLGKGHKVYLDNWSSNLASFKLLYNNCTNVCGTVGKNQQGMPKMNDRLKKGEASFRSCNNLLAIKWMNEKTMYMLSTMHKSKFAKMLRRKEKNIIKKPVCVLDYNASMRTAFKENMRINTVSSIGKSFKWYRKLFFHLLDICVWNAYCLYTVQMKKRVPIATFHLELIRDIFEKYHHRTINHYRTGNKNPLRLIERHFPSTYEPVGKTNRNRRCVVCSANVRRRESRYECKTCNVGLCIDPCFRIYHCQLNYKES